MSNTRLDFIRQCPSHKELHKNMYLFPKNYVKYLHVLMLRPLCCKARLRPSTTAPSYLNYIRARILCGHFKAILFRHMQARIINEPIAYEYICDESQTAQQCSCSISERSSSAGNMNLQPTESGRPVFSQMLKYHSLKS